MTPTRWVGVAPLLLVAAGPAAAAVPRVVPTVAEIVTARGDEQVRFVDDPARWLVAEVQQELAAGDLLRTGPYGGLAILFGDDTQIRVHRNSTLLVRSVRGREGATETLLRLERGAAWSRARAIPESLKMETPAATAGIRGTDWHLRVEDSGRSTLVVLAGEVRFFNAQGAVTVARGEVAVAEVGRAPTKTVLIAPRDRPRWELAVTPEWVLTLNVTGLSPAGLFAARERLDQALRARRDAAALVEAAEVAYEYDDLAAARRLLGEAAARRTGRLAAVGGAVPAAPLADRAALLDGLLLAREYRYDEARRALDGLIPHLAGRQRLMARLGRISVLVALRRFAEAEAMLAAIARESPDDAEVRLARVRLAALRGEADEAARLASEGGGRFPRDARFPVWLAHLAIVLDEPARWKAAWQDALALEPLHHLGWQLKGLYHQQVEADGRAAREAFGRALEIAPAYAPAWNSLARVQADLGDWEGARRLLLTAVRLAPNDAIYRASLATLLIVYMDEVEEGRRRASEALALDPGDATALRAAAYAAMKRSEDEAAVDRMLRATVADPGLGPATAELGVAYYQAGRFEAAAQAVENALRLDPNDPVAPLVGSIMAIDRAEAGRAVRLAREALDRFLRLEGRGVESLATSQSGVLNLGSAYANLGLDDWGAYYGQLAEEPHLAMSHFFLGTQSPSSAARRSEVLQGLLLDPLAVSARTRYFDFVRRPFLDVTAAALLGSADGALVNAQTGIAQGLTRAPVPLAYFMSLRRDDDAGFRENSAATTERADLGLGARLDARNHLLLSLVAERSQAGVPGDADAPDPDDRTRSGRIEGTLGWQHRLGPRNHLLARLFGGYRRSHFENDDPYGSGLSALSDSLIRAFGLDGARQIYAAGLRDGGILGPGLFAGSPIFFPVASGICAICPIVQSDIPNRVDLTTVGSLDTEEWVAALQARHLFQVGTLRATYGVEWSPSLLDRSARASGFQYIGTGVGVIAPNIVTFNPFPFGSTPLARHESTFHRHAIQGYAHGDWRPWPHLRLEAGLFARHWDDDLHTETTQLDPRAGVAVRLGRGHWLRAAGQRDLVLPLDGSLAPVAAVGLASRDDFTTAGGSLTTYQARWDAEWHPRVFTFAAAEQQRLRRFFVAIPFSLDSLAAEKGRIQALTVGAAAWLGEQWGVFARYGRHWTESLAKDAHRGRDLPLVPEDTLETGLTWVHPLQVRASLFAAHVGQRWADLANTQALGGDWTVNASANWQPDGKRWSLTLALQNLLDESAEVARGIPTPGFSVSLAAEYRWGQP